MDRSRVMHWERSKGLLTVSLSVTRSVLNLDLASVNRWAKSWETMKDRYEGGESVHLLEHERGWSMARWSGLCWEPRWVATTVSCWETMSVL